MHSFYLALRGALAALVMLGCAQLVPGPDAVYDLAQFTPHALDARVRYEPAAEAYAARVAALLPAAVAQVESGHYRPFAKDVTVYVCGSEACFAHHVPGARRYTAAVVFENRLVLAPRLFDREPRRLYPVLVHELSHLHLGQQLGHYTMGLPVWFHEGLASLVAAGGGADLASEDDALRAIAAGKHFMPDATHDDTRRKTAEHWRLRIATFYRQSMMFLAHLKARGEDRFRALMLALQERERFDTVFAVAFGGNAQTAAHEFFRGLRCAPGACDAVAGAP